jgi:hypothetical protein
VEEGSVKKTRKPKTRLNAVLYAMLLEDLVAGPATRQELMRRTGLSYETIMSVVRALHSRRLIHVTAWERDAIGRHSIAAFAFGSKADAKRPPALTRGECKRNQRARKAAAAISWSLAAGGEQRLAA